LIIKEFILFQVDAGHWLASEAVERFIIDSIDIYGFQLFLILAWP
jgi:hypothetical protein